MCSSAAAERIFMQRTIAIATKTTIRIQKSTRTHTTILFLYVKVVSSVILVKVTSWVGSVVLTGY